MKSSEYTSNGFGPRPATGTSNAENRFVLPNRATVPLGPSVKISTDDVAPARPEVILILPAMISTVVPLSPVTV